MNTEKDILLRRIANHLILHSIDIEDIGLFHGKMGVVLFFAHYARYTDSAIYDDFAGELLEEICENIPETLPINLETGLCGIGWGIEYLIQNGFMEGDSNEILTEIDKKVMERDLRRIKDLSLETGLMGISSYINIRINNADITAIHTNFDDLFLLEWNLICNNKIILDKKQAILQIIGSFPKNEDIHSWEFGLPQGSSGYGLRWILEETPVYSG